MSKSNMYHIAKCSTERSCKKCTSIGDAIVVNRGPHYTLYCAKCGAYLKHASVEDKRYIYAHTARVEDETPIKVCSLWIESERTMFNK